MKYIPPIFISHGSPMLMLRPGRAGNAWRSIAQALPRPRAILAVSAHWNTRTAAVGAAPRPETIHDFYGFPPELYELEYSAAGTANLADKVATLLPGIHINRERGLDHGAWSPLRFMYPAADIPVIQLAVMPQADAAIHFQLGRGLQSLTRSGVLIMASGGLTHNLGDIVADAADGDALPYVEEFREWFLAALRAHNLPALLQWRTLAPHATRAHPSPEHLLPLFVALGAAGDDALLQHPYIDSQLGALALDAFVFGQATQSSNVN